VIDLNAAEHAPHTPCELDAECIEKELVAIWRDAFQQTGDENLGLKIALSNLVTLSTPETQPQTENIIRKYAFRKPSRVIDIIIDSDRTEDPRALLSASCNLSDSFIDRLCWERITIEARPADLHALVGLVRSLLTGGEIPVLLVDLYGLKRGIDMRRKFYLMADYVFVDCHGDFQSLLPPPGVFSNQQIYGFDWIAINPIREAMRTFFDAPAHLDLIDDIRQIKIYCACSKRSIAPSAQLLAGWIISSLKLDVDIMVDDRIRSAAPSGAPVEIHFLPNESGHGDDLGVGIEMNGVDGVLTFQPADDTIHIHFDGGETPCAKPQSFDFGDFVIEQSSVDRYRSSYGASYRAAVSCYNLMHGISGRKAMIVVDDASRLAPVAARLFYSLAIRSLAMKDKFFVALAGGSTPKAMYQEIVVSPYARAVDWNNVYFFFGDERPVGPDHPDSNYRLARINLLEPLGIREENVFRIEGEKAKYNDTCSHYAELIRTQVPAGTNGLPRFDLIFLGIGGDGHTASLFPESNFDRIDPERIIIHNFIPKLNQTRISFSLNLINSSAHVFFVTSGEQKAEAMQSIFFPQQDQPVPAARVRPGNGNILWLVDREAVARLEGVTLPIEVSRW